ncbi:phosphatidylinositol mannoside acyltransferase [Solicola gregarius]|uniref:Phosphatidylinositol mannoside acyltransferase n=1 Tax=Solicola gregarius TaxID=2908642 RepID=A0AA46TG83_9ACTN|nr:phosphatidylinositol mannoside acyltransferase [Solicola gregarius]UYM04792.1 phosphatidylinositol mannoside acyltransferase [Solicola gregarius]
MRTDWAYRLGWTVACRVPEAAVRPALDAVADQIWRRRGKGVRRLESNLAHAVAPSIAADERAMRELSRRAMRSYLRYWGEVFRLSRWTRDDIFTGVEVENFHLLRDAHGAGRGVVGALPHMGNWELAGAWSCAMGIPLTAVAERLQPESLYQDFVDFRESLGMEIVPINGGPPVVPLLADRLDAGGFVCLLADRDLSRNGIEVQLLGAPARVPQGPALLARRTGSLLIPITSTYDDGLMRLRLHDPVPEADVSTMMQGVADAFSAAIQARPVDWHMLQRVFAADVERR